VEDDFKEINDDDIEEEFASDVDSLNLDD